MYLMCVCMCVYVCLCGCRCVYVCMCVCVFSYIDGVCVGGGCTGLH
jgi:hypothetical protein